MNHAEFDPSHWTLIESDAMLHRAADQLHGGHGSFGVDAERASGYTYFPSAYLIQVSRRGSGTFVIDPTRVSDFQPLRDAMQGEEWILHSAVADLDSLRERGLDPQQLFDTELAARLLGFERVNLGAIASEVLGVQLAKAHSASDWSKRPLPQPWLEYAALDVSLLPDLRDRLAEQLEATGKRHIAAQEFEAVLDKPAKPEPREPWRRLSGITSIKDRQGLAVARELWLARDEFARSVDVAPRRLLPDASIVAAALQLPRTADELARNKEFKGRASRSELQRWWTAVLRGKKTDEQPPLKPPPSGELPHHRFWEKKRPEAFVRLQHARHALELEAQRLEMPLENLLTPALLRAVAWDPPQPPSDEAIAQRLSELGARPWQIQATAQLIASSFVDDL